MKRIRSVAVLFALLAALTVPALGVGIAIDWDSVDWETFDLSQVFRDHQAYLSAKKWLAEEADFDALIAYAARTDSWYADDIKPVLQSRFLSAPEECLVAIAVRKPEIRARMYYLICADAKDPRPLVAAMEGVRLNSSTHPEAVEALLELIAYGEERFGVSITVPPTGDPIPAAVLGLLCATAGGIVLHKRERTFRRNEK